MTSDLLEAVNTIPHAAKADMGSSGAAEANSGSYGAAEANGGFLRRDRDPQGSSDAAEAHRGSYSAAKANRKANKPNWICHRYANVDFCLDNLN